MKTRLLLLAAATTLGFTACQNNNIEGSYTQEQLDSIVQFKVDSATNALRMENDSLINMMAIDSSVDATGTTTKTTTTKKTTNPKTGTTTNTVIEREETKAPPTIGDGKPKAGNQDANTIGSGKPKAGNQDDNTIGNGKPKAGNR